MSIDKHAWASGKMILDAHFHEGASTADESTQTYLLEADGNGEQLVMTVKTESKDFRYPGREKSFQEVYSIKTQDLIEYIKSQGPRR